jgi:3-carboxy-cis,cis-muconate cycloisomerase
MSVSVFEHPLLAGLLGDETLAEHFSAEADIDAMLRFETGLAEAEERAGLVPEGTGEALRAACDAFEPDLDALKTATRRDGLWVPELVRQLRAATGESHGPHIHFGATSQDVVDTALVMRLRPVFAELEQRLIRLIALYDDLDARFGENQVMGHTRMQRALPIRCADRLATWRRPLQTLLSDLPALKQHVLRLQLGGPVGTLDRLGGGGAAVSADLAKALDLEDAGCWHNDRAPLAEFAGWLSRIGGALGKFGQDVALMAQNERAEIRLSGGGGSSAMPHKQNPVSAEILVTLARFEATLLSGMHEALVHENERSGSAWTLEWMLLPQMVVATGGALRTAIQLAESVEGMGS